MKIGDIKKMLGTVVDPKWTLKLPVRAPIMNKMRVPESFDVRTNWP